MNYLSQIVFFILIFSIPFQIGKHFWFNESLVLGRRIDYLSPTLYLTDIVFFIWLAIEIFLIVKSKQKFFFNLKTLLVLILITLLLIIVSQYKIISLIQIARLWELFIFTKILIYKKTKIDQFIFPLGMGAITTVFIGLMQFLNQKSLQGIFYFFGERKLNIFTPGAAQLIVWGKTYLRAYSTFPHPNVFGGYLVSLLAVFLSFKKNLSTPKYLFCKFVVYLSVIGILISFSRMAWIATFFICIYFFYQQNLKKNNLKTLAIVILFLLLIEEVFVGRFVNLILYDQVSVFDRQRLVVVAGQMIKDNFLFGVGLNNFIPKIVQYMQPQFLLQPVHSIYLLIFCETGIVGIFLFFTLIVKSLKNSFKNKSIFTSLLIILFLGMFDHYFFTIKQTQWLFALLLATANVK